MSDGGAVVVVGGTRAIGFEIAKHYVEAGRDVILTGQAKENVDAAIAALDGRATGLTFDLAEPESIAPGLAEVGRVRHLVIVAIDRDQNSIRDYDTARATRLTVLKLVGYAEVVHTLLDRLDDDASIVLFGGQARFLPYPGSTTVTTVNGGVEGLTRALVHELQPIRVNCIHPGIVGDSPYWKNRQAALEAARARTPTGRLATMADIVAATKFLLEVPAINGVELRVDGGLHTSLVDATAEWPGGAVRAAQVRPFSEPSSPAREPRPTGNHPRLRRHAGRGAPGPWVSRIVARWSHRLLRDGRRP